MSRIQSFTNTERKIRNISEIETYNCTPVSLTHTHTERQRERE